MKHAMKQMTEHKRQRREYLLNRAGAYGKAITALSLTLGIAAASVALGCVVASMLCTRNWLEAGIGFCFLIWLYLGLVELWQKARQEKQRGDTLPYVPPVSVSTLPAEEILVRAADVPPVAQSTVLLRAAQAGQETPKEELLRVAKKG
jgi:hypothetical protein